MERLERQLQFINEIDKLKKIIRVNLLSDGSRRENSAEHSWHFAVMTWLLGEYAKEDNVDIFRAIKMSLIHDIVEIDAGDSYALDPNANVGKEVKEVAAAERLFGILPDDLAQEMWDLWREFELGCTKESRFARSIDRLNPFFQNYASEGKSWIQNRISKTSVLNRMKEVELNTPTLWPTVRKMIDYAVEHKWLIDS